MAFNRFWAIFVTYFSGFRWGFTVGCGNAGLNVDGLGRVAPNVDQMKRPEMDHLTGFRFMLKVSSRILQ